MAVLAPFALAVLVPFLYPALGRRIGWLVALLPFSLFVKYLSLIPPIMQGEPIFINQAWIPSMGINLTIYLDGLSLLFSLLITGIGTIITVYSISYLGAEEALGNFYVYILLFMGAMLGTVQSSNLVTLYVFWELTSISSFLLIGFWFHREESKYGALKSMLITVFGGLAMIAGFLFLYLITGTFEIREIVAQAGKVPGSIYYLPALVLILLGAFTKSAQFPFHIWLPNAMEAPTPISAYLHSATMVKAGIYLMARMTPVLGGTLEWFYILSFVGMITLVYGSFMAIRQSDLKAMLAFSTISQLGLITFLLGINTKLAVAAAVFHILNHATFKGSMFLVVGIVDHETGTRQVDRLGGLARLFPITALVMMLASAASAGLPPFNAFISKEMFFEATLHAGGAPFTAWLFPAAAVVGSIFTFVYSAVMALKVFFGPLQAGEGHGHGSHHTHDVSPTYAVTHGHDAPERAHGHRGHDTHGSDHGSGHHDHEAGHGHGGGHHGDPWGMVLPALALASLTLIIGLFPGLVEYSLVLPAASGAWGSAVKIPHLALWHGFNPPLFMSAVVVLLGLLGYRYFYRLRDVVESVQNARFNLNVLYDRGVDGLVKGARWLTDIQMTGYLRDYLVFISLFFIAAVGYTVWAKNGLKFTGMDLAPVSVYEYVLAGVMVVATLAVLWMPNRLAAILSLGVVGMGVTLMFILFRAPDLALTQLIVEAVSLAMFLLVFAHLPELKKEIVSRSEKAINAVVAVASGTLITMLLISGNATRLFDPISRYYVENSYKLGGGDNIVNVILVDFRGYDTMGEITVVAVAAFSVYALVKLRPGKGGKQR